MYGFASAVTPCKEQYLKKARKRYKYYKGIEATAEKVTVKTFDLAVHGHIAQPGYSGVNFNPQKQAFPENFIYVRQGAADGRVVSLRDRKGRTVAVIVRHEVMWDDALKDVVTAADRMHATMPSGASKRGEFDVIQLQLHRNTGTKWPMYSANYTKHKKVADKFLNSTGLKYYAQFMSSLVQIHFPRCHMRQSITNRKIEREHGLKPLFGVFQSGAYNFKRAATARHRDASNTLKFPCAVLVTEQSRITGGGQLVLEELKHVLELGPGDIVIFPSALITHFNIGLIEDQIRSSLALWCSANCEIWADEGCSERQAQGSRPARDHADSVSIYTA